MFLVRTRIFGRLVPDVWESYHSIRVGLNLDLEELQQLAHLWNTHIIHYSRNAAAPSGRPIVMYTIPHLFGEGHLNEISQEAVEACKQECQQRGPYPCDETVFSLCCLIMAENFLLPPTTADEAIELYLFESKHT